MSRLPNSLLKHDRTSNQVVVHVLDDSFIWFKSNFMSRESIEKRKLSFAKACFAENQQLRNFRNIYIRRKHLEN